MKTLTFAIAATMVGVLSAPAYAQIVDLTSAAHKLATCAVITSGKAAAGYKNAATVAANSAGIVFQDVLDAAKAKAPRDPAHYIKECKQLLADDPLLQKAYDYQESAQKRQAREEARRQAQQKAEAEQEEQYQAQQQARQKAEQEQQEQQARQRDQQDLEHGFVYRASIKCTAAFGSAVYPFFDCLTNSGDESGWTKFEITNGGQYSYYYGAQAMNIRNTAGPNGYVIPLHRHFHITIQEARSHLLIQMVITDIKTGQTVFQKDISQYEVINVGN